MTTIAIHSCRYFSLLKVIAKNFLLSPLRWRNIDGISWKSDNFLEREIRKRSIELIQKIKQIRSSATLIQKGIEQNPILLSQYWRKKNNLIPP